MVKYVVHSFVAICLVAIISASNIPPEFEEVAPEIRKVCLEETGADVELVKKANDGVLTPDDKLKCYLKCTLAQFGAITRKGINFDSLTRLAPPTYKDKISKVVKACRDTKATKEGDICDLVYEVSKCFQRTSPEDYFVM